MVISLVNTLVIATGERRREFTLHRLIGLTGRQIMRKRWEAVSDSSSEQLSSHSSAPAQDAQYAAPEVPADVDPATGAWIPATAALAARHRARRR